MFISDMRQGFGVVLDVMCLYLTLGRGLGLGLCLGCVYT